MHGFREVLARSSFTLIKIWNGVQAKTVDSHVQPEVQQARDFFMHLGIVVIKIGLMRVKAMPIVGVGDRVPGPVGGFEIPENDARLAVFFGIVAPDVKIAPGGSLAWPGGSVETRGAGRKCG